MHHDKKSLRLEFRAKREAVTAAERKLASQALVQHIASQSWYKEKQSFALYCAMTAEIDTQPLIHALGQHKKECYLPRITADNRLLFAHYTANMALVSNRFGIAESPTTAPLCAISDLDVIFMPLIAFDTEGHRLGMGAGFYDKTLADLGEQKKRPLLVGLAYELQKANHIPHDPWDVSLDIVVTEQAVHICH